MVRHVQDIPCLVIAQALGPPNCTRKTEVRRAERRFPDIVEFPEQPGDDGGVGVVIDKSDDTLAGEDEFAEGGPVIKFHGGFGRLVNVLEETGVGDRVGKVGGCDESISLVVSFLPAVVAEDDG